MAPSLRNRRTLVLAASLVLNVVFVAAAGTVVVKDLLDDHSGRRHSPFAIPGPRQLKAVLPEQDIATLDALLETHRPLIFGRIEEVRNARREAAEVLRRDGLTEAELDGLLADLKAREAAVSDEVYAMARVLFGRLGPDGRRAAADLVEGPPPRRPE